MTKSLCTGYRFYHGTPPSLAKFLVKVNKIKYMAIPKFDISLNHD